MKFDFGFFFRLLIWTAVLCALVYGLGAKTVATHTPLAFAMLASVMVSIGGMVSHLSTAEVTPVRNRN